jgi:hypothetical protein
MESETKYKSLFGSSSNTTINCNSDKNEKHKGNDERKKAQREVCFQKVKFLEIPDSSMLY